MNAFLFLMKTLIVIGFFVFARIGSVEAQIGLSDGFDNSVSYEN